MLSSQNDSIKYAGKGPGVRLKNNGVMKNYGAYAGTAFSLTALSGTHRPAPAEAEHDG